MRFREQVELNDAMVVDQGGDDVLGAVVGIDAWDDVEIVVDVRAEAPAFKFGAVTVPGRTFNVVLPLDQLLDAIGYLTDKQPKQRPVPNNARLAMALEAILTVDEGYNGARQAKRIANTALGGS